MPVAQADVPRRPRCPRHPQHRGEKIASEPRDKRAEKRQEQLEEQRVLGAQVFDAMVTQRWTEAAVKGLSVPKALALLVVKAPNINPSSNKRVDVFSALNQYVLFCSVQTCPEAHDSTETNQNYYNF